MLTLYWGIDQQLIISRPARFQGVDLQAATLRFDLGEELTQQHFLTVLDSSISLLDSETMAVVIPGGAIVQALQTEKAATLTLQLRCKPDGATSELVQQEPETVTPAYSEAVAVVESTLTAGELSGPAAVALSALRVVTTDATGDLVYADSSDTTQANKTVALTLQAFAQDDTAVGLVSAIVIDAGWNWDTELPIFVGSTGLLTQTAPTAGYLRQVATPISATSLYFEPQEAILL